MTDSAVLRKRYTELKSEYDSEFGEWRAMDSMRKSYDETIATVQEECSTLQKVIEIYEHMAVTIQDKFLRSVEHLVTSGIQSVFGAGIDFAITPSSYGKQPTLDFSLIVGGRESDDIMGSFGGGVCAVVGIILRIVVLRLLKESRAQILFLDETLGMLSKEYRESAARLLRDLSRDLEIQIVLVTHQPEYSEYADTTIRLESKNGVARVVEASM